MVGTCYTRGEHKKCVQIFSRKTWREQTTLETSVNRRWENGIKIYRKAIGGIWCEGMGL
jgi:hypothetical protein